MSSDHDEVSDAGPDLADVTRRLSPGEREHDSGIPLETDAAPEAAAFGPYQLVRELGRGGQGVVYLAVDTRLSREVALKILAPGFARDPMARLRFEREATAAARLDHPGICTVFEAGEVDEVLYMAMRYIPGESLSDAVKRARDESASSVAGSKASGSSLRNRQFRWLEIVEKVARALHVAHEAGLVHRDIKPGNVMLDADDEPVILDFGLARDLESMDVSLTGQSGFVGTPVFMSPEQLEGGGGSRVDRRTDVWSLGVTLYEMICGCRPFTAPSIDELCRRIKSVEPTDPAKTASGVSKELAAVITTCLDKDRDRRYATALDLAEDLRRLRTFEPVRARPVTTWVRVTRWIRRNRTVAAVAAVVIILLSTALGVTIHYLIEAEAARATAEDERVRADGETARAYELLDFMLIDLKDDLAEVGRLDLLGDVARKASALLGSADTEDLALDDARRRAAALRNVGDVVRGEGDIEDAKAHYERSMKILRRLASEHPDNQQITVEILRTEMQQCVAALSGGDPDKARAMSLDLVAGREAFAKAHPDHVDAELMVADGWLMRSRTAYLSGKHETALTEGEHTLELFKALVAKDPSDEIARRELAVAHQNQGEFLRAAKREAEGIEQRKKGLVLFEKLLEEHPASAYYREQIATTNHGLALIDWQRKDLRSALAASSRAVGMLRQLALTDPSNKERQRFLGTAVRLLAFIHEELGNDDESLSALEESFRVRTALAASDPDNIQWQGEAADAGYSLSNWFSERGIEDNALPPARFGYDVWRELSRAEPAKTPRARKMFFAAVRTSRCLEELHRHADAFAVLEEARELIDASLAAQEDPDLFMRRSRLITRQARLSLALGEVEGRESLFRESTEAQRAQAERSKDPADIADHALSWLDLRTYRRIRGDFDGAVQAMRHGVEAAKLLIGKHADAEGMVGRYGKQLEREKRIAQLMKGEAVPEGRERIWVADVHYERREWARAVPLYEAALGLGTLVPETTNAERLERAVRAVALAAAADETLREKAALWLEIHTTFLEKQLARAEKRRDLEAIAKSRRILQRYRVHDPAFASLR